MVSAPRYTLFGEILKKRSQADCVFPTRTARFGVALTFAGPLNLSELPVADRSIDLVFD
jgi:hypothetical protein